MKDKGKNVHVHLSYDLDAATWQQRYEAGIVPDKTPYGYHHLEEWGYSLTFSASRRASKAVDLLRRAGNRLLGFDLWHAWRNRKQMREAEAIVTYTEREYLGISLLRKLRTLSPNALLIANTIWLFNTWEELPRWKQKLYRWLIKSDACTVLTFHSEENLKFARSLFPGKRSELVRFGVSLDSFPLKPPTFAYERGTRPLRLLSLGSDPYRDWETLIRAVEGDEGLELWVGANLSYEVNRPLKRFADHPDRIRVEYLTSVERIREAYDWADIVVVPLRPNKHSAGTTVVLEAVATGKPVIVSNTVGLRSYFDDDEVCYVPPRDVEALARAIMQCVTRVEDTLSRARKAQAKLLSAELTTRGFASRHAVLMRNLLHHEMSHCGEDRGRNSG